MSLDHISLAKVLPEIRESVEADIRALADVPTATMELFRAHWKKPWVPGHLVSLLAPLRATVRGYLKLSVLRREGLVWHIPSAAWWSLHTRAHHVGGGDCSIERHVEALTQDSPTPMFAYADMLEDGRFRILSADDFKIEAGYWKAHFSMADAAGEPPMVSDEDGGPHEGR